MGYERTNKIIVIDNGTQYGQLYAKRFRDLGIEVETFDAGTYMEDGELIRPRVSLDKVLGYAGVVIAGGRSSVTDVEEKRVDIDPKIYSDFKGPVLGTCFGHQDMADRLGGEVIVGLPQCGPVYTDVNQLNPFFKGLAATQKVNSTHTDGVSKLPPGFKIIASSTSSLDTSMHYIDAMSKSPDKGKNNWRIGTQFHPETRLTEYGDHMLTNFIGMCGLEAEEIEKEVKSTPNIDAIVEKQYDNIREVVGDLPIFLPISGGVDSTTATKMILEAGIEKERIHAFHMDTGYNRLGESEEVVAEYHKMGWDFVELLDKKDFFANFSLEESAFESIEDEVTKSRLAGNGFGGVKLKDAVYSEHKRILFQTAYAQVIDEYQKKLGLNEHNSILVQGTNQADKVESGKGGKKKSGSAHIKTHHNVGEFIKKYKEAGHLLEPMDNFFKSDIYSLCKSYGVPEFFSTRRPFPGPGLLIRSGNHNMIESGRYTQTQIDKLAEKANAFSDKFGVNTYVSPIEAVGTAGDERAVGVFAVLQDYQDHEEKVVNGISTHLMHIAGQIPHYTTFSRNDCITRIITPLFEFDSSQQPSFTEIKHGGEAIEALQIFDHEVNNIVDELGLEMTQVVNYMISDNLGEEGKYTMVFRPWIAPDLMSGSPLIPRKQEIREDLVDRLRGLKEKYDFIGNICIDLTYKPIGGTEIN